jgi:hypothetical protein
MRTTHILALSASVVLVGGLAVAGVSAEFSAQHEAESTVRSIVARVAPDATASAIDIHGRPLFLADKGTVSTAYVDVTSGQEKAQWIVQDYRDNTVGLLDIYVPVTLPGGPTAQPDPLPAADGSFTDHGSVDGAEITYAATLEDGVLTVTADGTPVATVPLPGVTTAETVRPFVGEDGLSVNIQARNLAV